MVIECTAAELIEALRSGATDSAVVDADGALVVRVGRADPAPEADVIEGMAALPMVVIVCGAEPGAFPESWSAGADVIVADADGSLDDVISTAMTHPLAAVSLALLLRGAEGRGLVEGLVAESTAYSMLQGGPEFGAWLRDHPSRERPRRDRPGVLLERTEGRLVITLDRPEVRNALDARMLDELMDAFMIAAADDSLTRVELRGAGPAFCAGGDLDEFGTFADPVSAHVLRLRRSVGRAIASVADRVVAHVHGACYGSGIELPAFAGTVVADVDSRFALPELGLGLIPGAGGTVSLVRRIGRHRTAWLALSGRSIDAATGLDWGLVDEISSGSDVWNETVREAHG